MKVAVYEEKTIHIAGHSTDELELTEAAARKALKEHMSGKHLFDVISVEKVPDGDHPYYEYKVLVAHPLVEI